MKQLRLAVAGQTDVGRRRERNQDNVTHVVPTEEEVLERKGALFVVCDGMGGHAAGEVAAEIAVNSLRDEYFASDEDDIISAIAAAIKQTNTAIYSYARENPGVTGMGTTCVALVVHGGRAFFLNIGDSRAYILRNGAMRQVTMDHSWVAEQVRAGLLTEEQARTHAHRNVITRSLGTQPTVSADLFIETLHDGDRVLLCSDGLHGYVEERDIEREMLQHTDPEAGARNMIDMANANGGPDNITALIVHMLEVPEVVGELVLPSAPVEQEQIITRPMPSLGARLAPIAPIEPITADVPPPGEAIPLKPVAERPKRARGSRVAALALRMLAVAAILAIGLGIWDAAFGPLAQMRAANARVQVDIVAAQRVARDASAQDPASALAALAAARNRLVADLRDPQIDDQNRQAVQSVLDNQLAPAVRTAAQSYAQSARIEPVQLGMAVEYGLTCSTPGSATADSLSAVSAFAALAAPTKLTTTSQQTLYAVNNGILYQLSVPISASDQPISGSVVCAAVPLSNVAAVVALAADGGTVYALTEQTGGAYQVLAISPAGANPDGSPKVNVHMHVAVATPHGEVPTTLAAHGDATYVGFKAGAASAPGLWFYTGDAPKNPTAQANLTLPAISLAASAASVYAVLDDGTLGELNGTSHAFVPTPVQVQAPIPPSAAEMYTAATPVPTIATATATPTASSATPGTTAFASGAQVVADPAINAHVLVADGANNRVVRFATTPLTPGLQLQTQYVYGSPLSSLKQLAVSSNGTTLVAYSWSGPQLVAFTVPEPAAGG